ncbi:glycoside hydrolase family 71/99-like protein [Roseomonas elaeocarpi]|uniref:Glycoside hydrolase family 71/99-like protein n=1 Tax=Roseomonas elaeocarpi TaxID=907779 RepID=A0ABV6JS12_9PROT
MRGRNIWTVMALLVGLTGAGLPGFGAPGLPGLGLIGVARAEGLDGTVIMGYQGWFGCPDDPESLGRWGHWMREQPNNQPPRASVDMLPDVSGMPEAARCDTPLRDAQGKVIQVFSQLRPATLDTHFAWMQRYGIGAAMVARFAIGIGTPPFAATDRTLRLALDAAELHGRHAFVSYDLTDLSQDKVDAVVEDLRRLRAEGLLDRPGWQRHRGKPVIDIFGLGTPGIHFDAAHARALLEGLRATGPLTVMGGVGAGWRTLGAASRKEPEWAAIYRSLDIIRPWPVGAFTDDAGADRFLRDYVIPDLAETRRLGIGYMPVAMPGFSAMNLKTLAGNHGPVNQIPRRCGDFYWHQVRSLLGAGVTMLQAGQFDEADEGTAMMPFRADVPADARGQPLFLSRDADGCALPADWYLRLAQETARALRSGHVPGPMPQPTER